MPVEALLSQNLLQILESARFAPSVHNTQPWRVHVEGKTLVITIDPKHRLGDGDPTGRQTIISLGIFVEALCLICRDFDLSPKDIVADANGAKITFAEKAKSNNAEVDAMKRSLRTRASDRSIYKAVDIELSSIKAIEGVETDPTISVQVITDRKIITEIANLTSKGIKLAMSSPGFRQELSQYLALPWGNKKRGISVKSLYIPTYLALLQPFMVKAGLSINAESVLERKRWLSASAVVAILGDGDLNKHWFEAGRTYLRSSLAIEGQGLSQATSAAIVEASNYHDDIEEMLHTNQRILALIRIGKGHPKRQYSPRVEAEELLT
jgi:hypothetical protein